MANFSNLNILVVEDNVKTRKLIKMLLSDMGFYQVFLAGDGREAQQFLDDSGENVDLIICDWKMPHMSGIELLQQIRMTHENMPFLMITGLADKDSVNAARKFGVNGYIAKPFSIEQFEKKVSVMVSQIEQPA